MRLDRCVGERTRPRAAGLRGLRMHAPASRRMCEQANAANAACLHHATPPHTPAAPRDRTRTAARCRGPPGAGRGPCRPRRRRATRRAGACRRAAARAAGRRSSVDWLEREREDVVKYTHTHAHTQAQRADRSVIRWESGGVVWTRFSVCVSFSPPVLTFSTAGAPPFSSSTRTD